MVDINVGDVLKIEGEEYVIEDVHAYDRDTYVELDDGTDWYVFENAIEAGESAREYWEYMAKHDQKEFMTIVGEENLIAWSFGNAAGPGTTQVNSLEEWLDLWLDTPEEHFAGYDSVECDAVLYHWETEDHSGDAVVTNIVAYRNN